MKKLFLLSSCFFLLNSFETPPVFSESQKVQEKIVLENPEDIEKVFEFGSKQYENQKYQEAIEIFKLITQKYPGYADAHYYIGLSYFALEDYYLSLAYFLEANKIYGKTKSDGLFGAGLAYLSSGYTDEAKRAFEGVIRDSSDPELVSDAKNWIISINEQILQKEKLELLTSDLNFREGISHLDAGNYEKAEQAFRKVGENKKKSLLALYYLGNVLYLLEKYQEAVTTFEKIILIDPEAKIAQDAKLYTRVIEELTADLPLNKPYFFTTSLGTVYDSNLSYSDKSDIIIGDLAGSLGIGGGYVFNENFQAQYNYYTSRFSGINDNLPGMILKSQDFNLQKHNLSVRGNFALSEKIVNETEYNFNLYNLGGENFLFSNTLNPKIYYYHSPEWITQFQYRLNLNLYPVFFSRNSNNHNLGFYQYYYPPGTKIWLRGGYDFEKIFANDLIQEQSGFLTDGSNFNLRYQFANSLTSNSLSLESGFNDLWLNSNLRIFSRLNLNSYDNPEIYLLTSPIIDITTGKPDVRTIKNINKFRHDFLLNLGFSYTIPLYKNVFANLNYNFTRNISNISVNDFISRSYEKHQLNFNLNYNF